MQCTEALEPLEVSIEHVAASSSSAESLAAELRLARNWAALPERVIFAALDASARHSSTSRAATIFEALDASSEHFPALTAASTFAAPVSYTHLTLPTNSRV